MALRHLGELFSRRLRQEGGPELYAAAVVAIVNNVLSETIESRDARAASFTRETVVVETSHSAIAGLIHNNELALLEKINNRLQERFPNERGVVKHLSTKTGTSW